jgi:hypothetical protein
MEARSSRICVIATLKNIRFESNAIAPHHHRKHYVVDGRWNLGRKRLDIAAETEKCPDSVDGAPGHYVDRAQRGEVARGARMWRESNASAEAEFSVPQAVGRRVGNRKRSRTGQLLAQRGNRVPVAGNGTPLRAGNLFRGVNQHRQPQALAACRSPFPELLLTHCLSFWFVAKANPGSRLVVPDFFRPRCRKENQTDVIYFTESLGGPS